MNGGRLIAFEGVDGCGKSTQLESLAEHLRRVGCDVVTTYDPTHGPTGDRIRQMARSGEALEPSEELRWFVEDRVIFITVTMDTGFGIVAPSLFAADGIQRNNTIEGCADDQMLASFFG